MSLDDFLYLANRIFNACLGITIAALLWSLVHPEHFTWLRRLKPRAGKPLVFSRRAERTMLLLFYLFLITATVFNLHNLFTRG